MRATWHSHAVNRPDVHVHVHAGQGRGAGPPIQRKRVAVRGLWCRRRVPVSKITEARLSLEECVLFVLTRTPPLTLPPPYPHPHHHAAYVCVGHGRESNHGPRYDPSMQCGWGGWWKEVADCPPGAYLCGSYHVVPNAFLSLSLSVDSRMRSVHRDT
jgi:hypothetical protein